MLFDTKDRSTVGYNVASWVTLARFTSPLNLSVESKQAVRRLTRRRDRAIVDKQLWFFVSTSSDDSLFDR